MHRATVITSIFKGDLFLKPFMEDILQQTAFEQCEWYLLDAASPHDEFSTIEPYLKYDNIRYERLDTDPGVYSCWNHMIQNSKSEYITNANIDDRLFPESIERHTSELDKHPDIDLAYSENIMTNIPNETYLQYTPERKVSLYPCGPFDRSHMISHNYPHNHPMWRRSLHDRFGLFSEEYRSISDYDFWLRCLSGGVNDFHYIPEVLGIYYFNPEGVSTNPSDRNWRDKEESGVREKYRSSWL